MPITDSNAPSESSSVRARKLPAALFMSTSSGPSAQRIPIISSTAAASRTSQGREWILAARARPQFLLGRGEDFLASSADIDFRAQFEESLGCGLAQSGAAAGDQDALVAKQIILKHGAIVAPGG